MSIDEIRKRHECHVGPNWGPVEIDQCWRDRAELLRKYDALVERVESAQSHTRETLRLLQWDQLGWDVPEEVIESLGKADSELRALLEDDK